MYKLSTLQEKIDTEIRHRMQLLSGEEPAGLYIPVSYSMGVGGKRLRPVMLLMAYNLFSDDIENAMPAAVAIEMFHNFTLLHDDIMDRAVMRRNQPTVHKKFSENSAILSGDVMAFLTYRYLMECKAARLQDVATLITRTAIEVCEGQQLDMDFEKRNDVTADDYLRMIRLKTAVLLGCSLKSGALLAGAGNEQAENLYHYGINLGMAFQLQDDFLDTYGEQEAFGKSIGNDILSNKKTFLLIKALEKGNEDQVSELKRWLRETNYDPSDKIAAVTGLYNQLEIRETTVKEINRYFDTAGLMLDKLEVEEEKIKVLQALGHKIMKRNH